MAVALDANIASSATSLGGVSTLNVSTTTAAAANAFIVVQVSWFNNTTALITGLTVAGTACTRDRRTTNGQDLLDVWVCYRTATTPTTSTIAITWANTGTGGILVGAESFTGYSAAPTLVATNGATGTAASWTSGAATNTGFATALLVGGSGTEDTTNPTTSTATSGTEIHDLYNTGAQQGLVTGYKLVSTVASDALTGTLSNAASTANTGALAIYADSAGAAAAIPMLVMPPRIPSY